MTWALFVLALLPKPSEFTEGMQHKAGFFDLYWDASDGRLLMAIDRLDDPFLFHTNLVTGLGSNDVGLDRGKPGSSVIVHFHKVGNKVYLIQPNSDYRAYTDNPQEKQAVGESFASSTLWSAEIKHQEGERYFIDLADLAIADRSNIARTLKSRGEGSYTLDKSRSFYYEPNLKAFPDNTEVEVSLTFGGEPKGSQVRQVAADAQSPTLRQRLSFIRLPDMGYKTRPYHPNSGGFSTYWFDYAAPLDADLKQRFLMRHRLELKDPKAKTGEVVEPLIYYVDGGAPEDVRNALVEGASWWAQAFEAAGFKNAYQVKIMPPDMDPLDVRYNVIQWVHRSTRGWSYGSSISDPRTGELIKGHVTLGSLRVRQDRLIFEGMLKRDKKGRFPKGVEPVELALSRIRQLSAHEVGHTLGLAHNFVSSAQDRASVMDYPAPLVRLKNGKLDTSDVYDRGIGAWDKVSIQCLYGIMDDPMAEMNKILEKARKKGLTFLADEHSRSPASMHPTSHLWDNGENALDELDRLIQLRKHLLQNFGPHNLGSDQVLALLEEVLVPVYLTHRFQLIAASKQLGGAQFDYAFNDGKSHFEWLPASVQNRALDLLLHTLDADFLDLPDHLHGVIPPRPPGYGPHRELFERRTGDSFDHLALPETAAQMTLSLLLNAQRLNRLHDQNLGKAELPGVDHLLGALTARFSKQPEGRAAGVHRTVNHLVLNQLIELVGNDRLREEVRATVAFKLHELKASFEAPSGDRAWQAHYHWLTKRLGAVDKLYTPSKKLKTPPGSPI